MKKTAALILYTLILQSIWTQQYFYYETTGDQKGDMVYKNYWNEKLSVYDFYIHSPITLQTHEITLDKNFATLKWINTKKDGTVDVYTRIGNKITADVIRDGKSTQVTKTIDSLPWYASMEFGLGQNLRKEGQSLEFWNVLPDNLKAYKMKAEVLSRETLNVKGIPTPVLKVRVTVNGIPALFFNFLYWFREDDGLFIRFEGAKGPPGTTKTIMDFEKIED